MRKLLFLAIAFVAAAGIINQAWAQCTGYSTGGPSIVCQGTSATYFVMGGNTSGCSVAAVSGTGNTRSGNTVTWNAVPGNYQVTFSCSCGTAFKTVTIVSAPSIFSVGGGGSICSGGSANVTLSGSQSGVSYSLYANGVFMSSISGTGSGLTWTNQTTTGTYTVTAANGGCQTSMSGSASISVIADPTAFTVGGGGSYCAGSGGPTVTLSGSEPGVSYNLYINGVYNGTTAGTGSVISWGNQTSTGTYTVTANRGGCAAVSMSGSAGVSVIATPATFAVGGGGSYCQGSSSPTITLNGSEPGVTYNLYANGNFVASASGTGGALGWANQSTTTAGTYTINASRSGCAAVSMSGSTSVSMIATPTVYAVGGGGSYCSGSAGPSVTLSASESGVTYSLLLNGGLVTSTAGTGSAIMWSNQTGVGSYSVTASRGGCGAVSMSGSVTVSVVPTPIAYTVGGGGSYCSGGAGVSVTLSNSEGGVTYSLLLNGGLVTSTAGTGTTLTWGNQTGVGTYTVTASRSGCGAVAMTGSAGVSLIPNPVAYTVGGGGSFCSGGTGRTITLSNSESGVTYNLLLNGSLVTSTSGTGVALSWSNQTGAGTYTVTASRSGCTAVAMNGSASVAVNALPSAFTVSGGGAFCAGGTGPSISLSGSQVGTNYQLVVNGTNSGAPLAGTGSALSWTNQTTGGTYTVVATNASTCVATMSGSSVVTVNPLPTAFSVGGAGAICAGGAGLSITLSGSQVGVNYQLRLNGTNSGAPVAGTGSSLAWTNQSAAGAYTVVATNASTSCVQTMAGSATLTINPLPTAFNVTGGGGVCVGGAGTTITLGGSQVGVNYQLRLNGTNTGAPIAGTGSSLTWTNQTAAGSYTVVATNATTSCSQVMTGTVMITSLSLPALFTLSGGGSICSGATGSSFTLSGSATGINYQLRVNGTNTGALVAGTGAAISWTNQTTSGTYTVLATDAVTSCSQVMTGSPTLTVNPLPTLFTVAGGGSICAGGAGVSISLSSSQSGVNYQLLLNGVNTGAPTAGTGSALSWPNQATAGTYTVVATNATTSCVATMTGNATVTINALPATFTVAGGGTICSGAPGVSITLSGSATGVNYQLRLNGTNTGSPIAGTGASLTWAGQTAAGTYTVVATNATTSCVQTMTGSASVTVNALPTLFSVGGGGAICSGGSGLNITLSGSQAGVNYQLLLNGTNVGSPLAGNGAALSFVNQLGAGTYTVVATNATTSCSQTMTGNASITINALPTSFTVGGGGVLCQGGAGVSVTLSSSQTGVNYQLKINGTNSGAAIAGTGSALTWSGQNTAGTYTVTATNATTSCVQTMSGNATVTVNPTPTSFAVGGGGGYCTGGTGVAVTLAGSTIGVNYQLQVNATNSGTPVAGTGAALTWSAQTASGTYTVIATNASTGCVQSMTGSATVVINPLPTVFTVSGGGTVCAGSGSTINLSGSQTGVNYQLVVNSVNTGSPVAGTGAAMAFASQTTVGTYTIVATHATTGCVQNMTGSATIANNPLPTLFTLSGGGSICAGAAGLTLTLSGSQAGVTYQLKVDGVNTQVAQTGNGTAKTWTSLTAAGTYTVLATLTATGCTQVMTGSPVIVVNPLPTVYAIGGGGTYCSGGAGLPITLANSQSGVNYQLKVGATNVGTPLAGTGSALTWANTMAAGTYTIVATNATTACVANMSGSTNIVVNALPQQFTVGGAGAVCSGSGRNVTLSGSATSATYQLKRDNINVGTAITGTGAALTWANQGTAGTYTVLATVIASGCTNLMTGSAVITVNPLPTLFTVSGGGTICSGAAGLTITLSGTQTGVNYRMRLNGTLTGTTIAGTGSSISWASQTAAGTYTVQATDATTTCGVLMTGSATITVNPLPTAFTIGGGGAFCSGGAGVAVTLPGSDVGVNYQLRRSTTPVGSAVAGTGGALSWPGNTTAGSYNIVATNATTGCTRTTASVTVTVNALPTVYTVAGGGSYCEGGTGVNVTLSNSATGISYQLRVNGVNSGIPRTGPGAITFANQTAAGTYTVVATNSTTGCTNAMTGSATVTIKALPIATISGPTSVGSSAITLSANTGANLSYQWRRDGDVMAGQTSSTTNVDKSGSFQVVVTSSVTACSKVSDPWLVSKKIQPLYNGIAASMRWRTDKTYGAGTTEFTGMYVFDYDALYQLTEARFATPNFIGNSFSFAGNNFRVSDMSYDPNGNILALRRYNGTGARTNDFTYRYNTGGTTVQQNNQLRDIPGYSTYAYDAVGQLITDDKTATSGDQFVDYDALGRVTNVYSDAGKTQLKITNVYDDQGFRLAKVSYVDGRTTWYNRAPDGKVLSVYETVHATGTTSKTEVPIYAASKLGVYYPSPGEPGSTAYELTDHLGNVRAIVKEQQDVYLATMEDNNVADITNPRVEEMQYFERLFETEVNDYRMNKTSPLPTVPTPTRAAYLYWNDTPGLTATDKAIGPAITLKVQASDTIRIEGFARYERQASFTRNVDLSILSALLGTTFTGTNGIDVTSTVTSMFQDGLSLGGFLTDTNPNTPYAYMNYILFDTNFDFVDGGVVRVDEDGAFWPGEENMGNFDHVEFTTPIITTQAGYIYVWASNESRNAKVWFDDIKVTHSHGIVTQATDYEPWGLVMREQKSEIRNYRFGFQGKFAEKDLETGWNHFDLREYDPAIARWISGDLFEQHASPYLAMSNNPIVMADPDGGYTRWGALWRSSFGLTGRVYQSGKDGNIDVWGFERDNVHYFGEHTGNQYTGAALLIEKKFNIWEKWERDDSFLGNASYDFFDAAYVTAQFFTPWQRATHLNDQETIGWDKSKAFSETLQNFLPTPGSKFGISAPQFSKLFKGTFIARMSPKARGYANRLLNMGFLNKLDGYSIDATTKAAEITTGKKD